MSSYDELKDALRTSLSTSGTLSSLRSHLRSEIFHALNNPETSPAFTLQQQQQQPRETHLLNALVAEYLTAMGYRHALSVFVAETGTEKVTRKDAMRELNVEESTGYPASLPLLHGLAFQNVVTAAQQRSDIDSRERK
ncbi:hypothetical protein DFJ77DRAFT_90890 [Powellomyces hirtus]|nr:hypothetical protein DFJ77DRAFT_90890 [Powellomyces hirtus]